MAATSSETIRVLNRLVRIANASERGFNLASENVKNRGLSAIFKGYAQQRGQFAQQLRALMGELGGRPAEGSGPLPALHRGWINIKAAMTIGQPNTEKVVLSEVSRGEHAARDAYQRAMQQPLPEELRAVVEQQQQQIQAVGERIGQLRGDGEKRLVVRLFDSAADAQVAEAELAQAGFSAEQMSRVPLAEAVMVYEGLAQDRTEIESAAAGGALGSLAGLLIGLIAAISSLFAPIGPLADMGPLMGTVATVLIGLLAGLFIGALFGAIIGVGIAQEDEFRYASSLQRGNLLLLVHADESRADLATQIMKGVNARRWSATRSALPETELEGGTQAELEGGQ
jgi:uncharacterized protein (TIGR02284 family)